MKIYLNSQRRSCDAKGKIDENGYTVLKGSILSSELSSNEKISKKIRALRDDEKTVKDNKLLKNVTFKSATLSAQFVLGDIVNGLRAWKDSNNVPIGKIIKK